MIIELSVAVKAGSKLGIQSSMDNISKWAVVTDSIRIGAWDITEEWLNEIRGSLHISHELIPITNDMLIDKIPAIIGGISGHINGVDKADLSGTDPLLFQSSMDFGKNRFELGFQIDDVIQQCATLRNTIFSHITLNCNISHQQMITCNQNVISIMDKIQKAMITGFYRSSQVENYEQAIKDKLTKIYNNDAIGNMIENEIYRSKRYRKNFSIAFISIDGLKQLDPNGGTSAQDKILKNVAVQLVQFIRATDFAARCNSGEFTVLMPETDLNEAKEAVDRVRRSIKQESVRRNNLITLSSGIVEYSGGKERLAELQKNGKLALKKASLEGGNTTSLFSY